MRCCVEYAVGILTAELPCEGGALPLSYARIKWDNVLQIQPNSASDKQNRENDRAAVKSILSDREGYGGIWGCGEIAVKSPESDAAFQRVPRTDNHPPVQPAWQGGRR